MSEQEREFQVGDRVTWVHVSSGKNGKERNVKGAVSWSLRSGMIESIIAGDVAAIRYGKKLNYVALSDLDKAAEVQMARIVERFR